MCCELEWTSSRRHGRTTESFGCPDPGRDVVARSTVVVELHREIEVLTLDERLDGLQVVALLA